MDSLFCQSDEDLMNILGLEKPFQARIVSKSLIKGVTSFSEISSLPKAIRERLSSEFSQTFSSRVITSSESPNAIKLLLKLNDDAVVECVRLSDDKNRYTACLSSQVGCKMGCAFCKTGTMGFIRNLTAGEIFEQYIHLERLGEKIQNIVFMGMGEPLNNFQEVIKAISFFHKEDGLNISYRKITISTCGIAPGIKRLAELNIPVKLAVSLVSANDKVRSEIMPVNRAYPLKELKKALMFYYKTEDRRITLEYCLLKGINTSRESAAELASFSRSMHPLVNLIPWNRIDGLPFETPGKKEIDAFCRELEKLGVNYTIRLSKGRDNSAACGMLATSVKKEK